MATIKSYTDLQQSKKLAEILPLESADMHWQYIEEDNGQLQWFCFPKDFSINQYNTISAWSLAALLDIIPCGQVNRMANSDKWEASSWNDSDFEPAYYVEDYDNPVDACVAMIEKLNELKML